ncbi:MAG: M1 family metallopeptidase [candidate division NC10 bacterium]|nr:M1 family metallopeptidase [candidate division NC10 bacterium]
MHSYRLPLSVAPGRYEIRIEPDLATGTFTGTETVEVTVKEPVGEIVLNAADLLIEEVAIQDDRGRELHGTASLDAGTERAHLFFPEVLSPGPWRLRLAFRGTLNDKLRGFYRSRVKAPAPHAVSGGTEGGGGTAERLLAVTQFEATDARRAFPCWDEPSFKAVFQVTLVLGGDLTAISNTRVLSETRLAGSGKKEVRFAPTIKMPSYLVAFVIGRLEATGATSVNGTPIRIWCVPGKTHLAKFAQEIATFSLGFFQGYYGMAYPGDKLDLIAIPDFAFGAMENLGAITFRENALLVDERTATHAELERVADVVAHEIAHMWFGDLVTMAWWNGLWLNEAFATFMEVLAVDAWKPAWERWVTFGLSRAAALQVDGLGSSRAIEFEVIAPSDAEAMFDVLTYEKGGAVLRMLEQYLGPTVFRDGVRRYLSDHSFGNAEAADLWRALGRVANQPIPEIMDGWIFRPGYPMVTIGGEDGGRTLRLSQRRFTYLADETPASGHWRVPITLKLRVNGETRRMRVLLSAGEERLELPGQVDWVVGNEGGHGFYRVRYAPDLLAKLAERPFDILAPVERFNLINDTWAAALAGFSPVGEYLDLTARFRVEADRNVWAALLASFAYLNRIIPSGDRPLLEAMIRDRLARAVARLGWTPLAGESELLHQLRGELLRAMGTLGNDPTVQATAEDLYRRARRDPSAADPNVLAAAITVLAHAGGEAEFSEFLGRFKTAQTPQEEQRYLYALAAFRDGSLLRRTLHLTVSGEVRAQDAPYLVRSLLSNVDAGELAWRFVKEHWETMERQFPHGGIRRMCEGITALASPALEADVRHFFASRKISLGGKTLEQYLEQLRIAVAFQEREAAGLAEYLSRFR